MYKCIPYSGGVDVSVNRSAYFTFRRSTHNLTDSGNNLVRISRKIDGLFELLDTPVTDFVDINSTPIATNYADLLAYFIKDRTVLAGEGVSVNEGTVTVVAGGPSTLGGFKVGTGLTVDGAGRLSASATSEITRVLNTESEMLALTTDELRSYRVIRLDTKRLYYLNASTTPSVLGNWFVGPSIETTVLNFKGRTGVVDSEFGDYNFDLIPMVDKSNSTNFTLVVDDGKLYIQNMTTSSRVEISYVTETNDLAARTSVLEDLLSSPTGLNVKFTELKTEVERNSDTLYNTSTGLQNRVIALENDSGSGTDYSADIAALQVKDSEQDSLITQVDAKTDSVANNNTVLDQRVTTLENRPSGTDYSTQISTLESKNVTQDTRLAAIDASLLTKAPLVAGKVPYENLPEFPVGRKVNVANQAARFALSIYTDLTIAYQSDTGDAWGLDANADPAISSNWSKLGNAQALGVSSFNGRTGNIGPMTGDYNTGQVTELVDKRFVTADQIVRWDSAATSGVTSFNGRKGVVVAKTSDYTTDMISESVSKQFISSTEKSLISAINTRLTALEAKVSYVRTWKLYNNTTERVQGTWYTNTNPHEIVVDAQSNTISNFVFLRIDIKPSADGVVFSINSNNANGSVPFTAKVAGPIPAGWMYRVTDNAGGNTRLVSRWIEFS